MSKIDELKKVLGESKLDEAQREIPFEDEEQKQLWNQNMSNRVKCVVHVDIPRSGTRISYYGATPGITNYGQIEFRIGNSGEMDFYINEVVKASVGNDEWFRIQLKSGERINVLFQGKFTGGS